MKHRIVAVSPQGKEYFGTFDESVDPQKEWQKTVDAFKPSGRTSYKIILESGDTLIVPNIKDWHIVIQKEPEEAEDFEGYCNGCKFNTNDVQDEPCVHCINGFGLESNWQPK